MPDATDLPLRDIHLPEPVSGWPLAPGWWLLAATVACALLISVLAFRRHGRGRLRREARRELEKLRARYGADRDGARLAAGLSELLRRVAISRFPRETVAGLTGDAWLRALDRIGGLEQFESGPGRALTEAPYRSCGEVDGEALLILCERWLRRAAWPQ